MSHTPNVFIPVYAVINSLFGVNSNPTNASGLTPVRLVEYLVTFECISMNSITESLYSPANTTYFPSGDIAISEEFLLFKVNTSLLSDDIL